MYWRVFKGERVVMLLHSGVGTTYSSAIVKLLKSKLNTVWHKANEYYGIYTLMT